jgi:hypothetical protein
MATMTVTITDATGSKEQQATVPDDAPAIRLIARLISLLQLPLTGPDGQPLSYKFHHRASGRQLRDEDTLRTAGVSDGDQLRLVAEITAG